MATLGTLLVSLEANTAKFVKGITKANKSLDKLARNSQRTRRMVNVVVSGIIIQRLAVFQKSLFSNIDTLAKTSDKLGVTTEALAGMRYAADISGVGIAKFDMALQRMTRRLSEAGVGTGEAQGAIAELGLDAQKLAAASPDQAFLQIADAMQQVTNQSDRVRLAFKFFDSEGVALVNTLNLGRGAIEDYMKEAEALGLTLNRIDAAKVEQANDAMTRLGGVFKGIGNTIAVELAAPLASVADNLVEAAKKSDRFRGAIRDTVQASIGFMADFLRATSKVVTAIDQNRIIAELGLIGYVFLGKKGFAIGAAIGAVIQQLEGALGNIATQTQENSEMFRLMNQELKVMLLIRQALERGSSQVVSPVSGQVFTSLDQVNERISQLREGLKVPELKTAFDSLNKEAVGFATVLDGIADALDNIEVKSGKLSGSKIKDPARATASPVQEEDFGLLQRLQTELSSYATHYQTLEEMEVTAFQRRSQMIEQAFANDNITRESYNNLTEQLQKRHSDKMAIIETQKQQAIMSSTASFFGSMSQLVGSSSKKQFELSKKFARAETIISTYVSAQKAYESMSRFGPIAAAAAAAAAIGAGFARLAAINRTSYGSSTAAATATGAGSFVPSASTPISGGGQDQSGIGQNIFIIMTSDGGSQEISELQIDSITELLSNRFNNGDLVAIRKESRQAAEIAEKAVEMIGAA